MPRLSMCQVDPAPSNVLDFFLPLRLYLRRGRQTGFGKRVQRGLAEIKEVHS